METKRYIDASWYSENYKPNKNARIEGRFNNVQQNQANFESFAIRGAELINRLTGNKIVDLGGLDYLGEYARDCIKKANGALVEYWFTAGFDAATINSQVSIGGMSFSRVKDNDTFRKFVPMSAIALIQNSGLSTRRLISVSLTDSLEQAGILPQHILTVQEAFQLFERKGDYVANYFQELSLLSELTGLDTEKYVKVITTAKKRLSFEITGGNDADIAKAMIFIDVSDPANAKAEAYTYSTKIANVEPKYFYKQEADGKLSFYIGVSDKLQNPYILINGLYDDDSAELDILGSTDQNVALTEIPKANILQNADLTALADAIKKVEADIKDFNDNKAPKITTLEAEINTLYNVISQAEADIDIVWEDATHLEYRLSGAKSPLPYQVIDITTAGAVITSTAQVDVWSRIKNKNNQYEVILTKANEKLKYTFNGGYELTITATADNGNAKFLYNAQADKIFIIGTNATLTDNKGQANVAMIQLNISGNTIGATAAKANYEFTLATPPTAGDTISKIIMKTSDEKLLEIITNTLKLLDAYSKTEVDAKIAGKADAGVSYTKTESDSRYERLATTFTPTATHQAGFIIVDETGIKDLPIGEYIRLDLKGIDDMISDPTNTPAAGDQMFIGDASIRIINSAGSAALKWETKTNPTDANVKDNYKAKDFVLIKKSQSEYDFVRLENKSIHTQVTWPEGVLEGLTHQAPPTITAPQYDVRLFLKDTKADVRIGGKEVSLEPEFLSFMNLSTGSFKRAANGTLYEIRQTTDKNDYELRSDKTGTIKEATLTEILDMVAWWKTQTGGSK